MNTYCELCGSVEHENDTVDVCKEIDRLRSALAKSEALTAEAVARAVEPWREAVEKAQNLYEAANRSLEDTDEDPEAEQGQEMAQVYTLRSSWARLCDAVDEIDVDGPGFKALLSGPAQQGKKTIGDMSHAVNKAMDDLEHEDNDY
jgi:hypothetical protein